ncbi:hypothetical protein KC644_03835 [Candidatus Berkelbacteria bacterium]|nr:hypothetical protein [Candidatus Berkelbacteria bacterium]
MLSLAQIIFFILAIVINLLLGLIVIRQASNKNANQLFLAFILSVLTWLIFNFLTDVYTSNSLLFSRLTYFGSTLISIFLVYFSYYFPRRDTPIGNLRHITILVPAISILLISVFTNLVVQGVKSESWGIDIVPGDLNILYPVFFFVYSLWSINILRKKLIISSGRERSQILYVIIGLILSLVAGFFTNSLSFFIIGDYRLAKYGPHVTLFLAFAISYAIVAHRLFDIRVIIKRTVVFTGVSAFVLGLYSSIVFLISGIFGSTNPFAGENLLPSVIGALAVAFGFNPVYKWLTDVTDRWLFRGEYKQEDVLHKLADTLANVIDLEEAIRGMMQVVVGEMRLEKAAVFMLHTVHADNPSKQNKHEHELKSVVKVGDFNPNTLRLSPRDDLIEYFEYRGISNIHPVITEEASRLVDDIPNGAHKKVTSGFINRLEQAGAAIAMPLVIKRQEAVLTKPGEPTKTEDVDTLIGVLLLGAKKSGDVYSDKDLKLLQIVASETAAAVEKSRFFEEDRLKSEFVSIASHELLTPTTSMKGFLSMVLDEGIGKVDDQAREQLEKVYSESKRLANLVKDLLNVSRIERNKIIVEPTKADIVELAQQAVNSLELKAKEQKLGLKFIKPKKKIMSVSTDPEKAVEIMINLIGNSLKYTKKGGVEIEIKPNDENIFVNVTDTGIGISRKDLSHLFTKFYRASNVDETQASGTGLGLYVSKHVAELMGGTITVQSELGKGSTFTFVLPVFSGKSKKTNLK